ncbi:MAG TPA: MobF family relaxase [Acidimicrobiales bacterium]|nr:MobF family relaxase [Acidimicrobiales bacterium]
MIDVASLHDPDYHLREVTHDPSAYYLRQGEAPGRWRGFGATALGLQGEVQPQALHDIFDGKHPASGEYLISAQGSSVRSNARDRERHVDVKAAAATLGVSEQRVRALLRSGQLAGEKTTRGAWRIPTAALNAFEDGGNQPRVRADRPAPGADGAYALVTAAAIAGVNPGYLRRITVEEAPEVSRRQDGRPVQYVVGFRDASRRWRIPAAELDRYMGERTAARAVPAYDLAVRAPKSVSVLHALGHLATRDTLARLGLPPGATVASEVLAAHHAAVDEAIGFLEHHAAFVRGPGGRVPARGLTVAVFDHRSSRSGDPLLHSHLVIANAASGVDGRTAALDSTALYAWARPAGHVYQARLRWELTRRLGVSFHQPHNGVADIVGVPREVIDLFSARRRQILERMARLGTSGAKAAQAATLDTRVAKGSCEHGLSPDELATRADAVGFGVDQLTAALATGRPLVPDRHEVAVIAARLAGPDGLCARDTTVDLRDALCGCADELPGGATATDLERWANEILHDPSRFIPVATPPSVVIRRADGTTVRAGGVGQAFTTPELLDHEAQICALHAAGLGPDGSGVGWGVATPETVAAALTSRPTLRDEQRSMIEQATTSGIGVEVVVGRPGSGKTYALGVAAEAWRAAGYRVIGCSLQGGASEVLAVEATLSEQYTLTGLLVRCDRQPTFLAGSVVICDEAGMADTRQLARLATHAAAAHAKLVLVGDPDQIPEVDAGGAFAHLVDVADGHGRLITLAENHRQHDAADRDRLEMVRAGRGGDMIDSATRDGRWHRGDTADDVREQLLRDWHADPGVPAAEKLLIATTVAEVEQLNTAARAMLAADGKLGDSALAVTLHAPNRAVDTRELRVGDRVRATRNRRGDRVFTGRVGTVMAVDPEAFTVTVELDRMRGADGRWRPTQVVALDREFLTERQTRTPAGHTETQAPGLTHAYASTANAVQGRTASRAYVLVSEAGLYRQAAYVALSRARIETHLYGLTIPDPDEIDRQAHAGGDPEPDPDNTSALAAAVERDAAQAMATVTDPLAPLVRDLIGRPAPWLWAERDIVAAQLCGRAPLIEALRQVRTILADTYGLPLAALECHQLTAAMTAPLQIPGATPAQLARLMLTRGQAVTRELSSADDPMAVLVWAAGTHAVNELTMAAAERDAADTRPPEARAREAALEDRLRLLDATIARQRDLRLAAAEHNDTGPIAGLVGSLPATPAGRVAWRRAAAAILDYRDRTGTFDRDDRAVDPWERALGPRPGDARLASHYDQVCAVVDECRASVVLAELPRFVPAQPGRPDADVARHAARTLADLNAEIADLRNAPAVTVDATRIQLLAHAARLRADRLTSDALNDPPPWLRTLAAAQIGDGPDPGEVAETARRVAMWADTIGTAIDAATLDEVLGPRPADPSRAAEWDAIVADVAPAAPAADPTAAVDLGL